MENRSQTLDILRCLAVVLVLCRHSWVCSPKISTTLHAVTQVLKRGGWIGVDMFFVLSGFLISGLLFKECHRHQQISLSRFFVRRGLKIYPPFWVLILFTVILESVIKIPTSGKWILGELLFVQNYWDSSQWGYTWSLAVEEHFYIFLPLLLVVLIRVSSCKHEPFGKIPLLFGVIAVTCLLLRFKAAHASAFSTKAHLVPTHLRIDSLFFGVLLSFYYHYHRQGFERVSQRFGGWFIIAGSCLLVPAFVFDQADAQYLYTFGYTEFYVGSGLLLVGLLGTGVKINPLTRCLAFIGSRSYSIYLWHGPVFWFASERFSPGANFVNWYGWSANAFGGAILMGIAMAALVEYPIVRLRDRWFPSLSQSPSISGGNFGRRVDLPDISQVGQLGMNLTR